jgi:hypothetical protein
MSLRYEKEKKYLKMGSTQNGIFPDLPYSRSRTASASWLVGDLKGSTERFKLWI